MDDFDLGSEIHKLVSKLQGGDPAHLATARVKTAWNRAVPASIAKHVTGVFVVPETQAQEVIVYVDSQLVATDLTMQADPLRMALNVEVNKMRGAAYEQALARGATLSEVEQVKCLRFRVTRDRYLSKNRRETTFDALEAEQAKFAAVEPVALGEEELNDLREAVSHIEDDRLREAAYNAAVANLEWQKGLAAAHLDEYDTVPNAR